MDAHVAARGPLASRYTALGNDVDTWLREKALKDSVEGGAHNGNVENGNGKPLWCVHGKWYDLSKFIDQHPGGSDWIRLTSGHDITEAFEVHHLNMKKVQARLDTMYVCDAAEGYTGRYAWSDHGFYMSLKRKVTNVFGTAADGMPDTGPTTSFLWLCGAAVSLHLVIWLVAALSAGVVWSVVAGLTLQALHGVGHNALHRRDNVWMYAYDLCGWKHHKHRVSHAMSHHLFPNTALDLEHPEPVSYTFTSNSHENSRWVVLIGPLAAFAGPLISILELWKGLCLGKEAWRNEYAFNLIQLLAFMLGSFSVFRGVLLFCVMHLVSGFCIEAAGFGLHRSIFCWSQGDPNPKYDFAEHCLATTADHDVHMPLIPSLFLFQILNNHGIHHLFPTVDKSRIHEIMPLFAETCREFGVPWQEQEWADMFGSLWKNWLKKMYTDTPMITSKACGHDHRVLANSPLRIVPLPQPQTFGAEITGVKVWELTQEEWEAVRQACTEFSIVVFREQAGITPDQQLAFAMRFPHDRTCDLMHFCGPIAKEGLDADEWRKYKLPSRPEIQLRGFIDLKDHYGVSGMLDTRKGAREFHTDSCHEYSKPPVFTSLMCVKSPGGDDTLFLDARLAYDRLDAAEKKKAESLFVQYTQQPTTLHDSGLCADFSADLSTLGKIYGDAVRGAGSKTVEISKVHPLVWTHPETGRKAIVVAPMWAYRLIDADGKAWTAEESHKYIYELLEPASKTLYPHRWRPNDLVVFDNRSVLHSAAAAKEIIPGDRLLHQIILAGDRVPVGPVGCGEDNPAVNPNVMATR